MEIKKGDRFRCVNEIIGSFCMGQIYRCELDGSLTDGFGYETKIPDSVLDLCFERLPESNIPNDRFNTYWNDIISGLTPNKPNSAK